MKTKREVRERRENYCYHKNLENLFCLTTLAPLLSQLYYYLHDRTKRIPDFLMNPPFSLSWRVINTTLIYHFELLKKKNEKEHRYAALLAEVRAGPSGARNLHTGQIQREWA